MDLGVKKELQFLGGRRAELKRQGFWISTHKDWKNGIRFIAWTYHNNGFKGGEQGKRKKFLLGTNTASARGVNGKEGRGRMLERKKAGTCRTIKKLRE